MTAALLGFRRGLGLVAPALAAPGRPAGFAVCQPLRKSTLRRQAAAEPPPEPARPSSSPQQPPATPSARQQAAPPPPPATRGAQQTGWPSIGTWQGKLLYGGGLLLLAALCFSAGRSLAGYLCPVFFVYILWDPLNYGDPP